MGIVVGIVVALVAALVAPAAAQGVTESQLEAAIVSKLPQFVEWPEAVLASSAEITLCVAGTDSVATDLETFVTGETLNGKPLTVRRMASADALAECRVLFIPRDAGPRRGVMMARARGLPVLTVGESDTFLDAGGMMRLRLLNGRMRFDVNLEAARQSGVRFSSQLLALAASVRGTP